MTEILIVCVALIAGSAVPGLAMPERAWDQLVLVSEFASRDGYAQRRVVRGQWEILCL